MIKLHVIGAALTAASLAFHPANVRDVEAKPDVAEECGNCGLISDCSEVGAVSPPAGQDQRHDLSSSITVSPWPFGIRFENPSGGMGTGIPLFQPLVRQIGLERISCEPLEGGCVYVLYQVQKDL